MTSTTLGRAHEKSGCSGVYAFEARGMHPCSIREGVKATPCSDRRTERPGPNGLARSIHQQSRRTQGCACMSVRDFCEHDATRIPAYSSCAVAMLCLHVEPYPASALRTHAENSLRAPRSALCLVAKLPSA